MFVNAIYAIISIFCNYETYEIETLENTEINLNTFA